MSDGSTTVAVGVEKGRAVLRFPKPIEFAAFDSANAMQVAEALSRAAYEAHHGKAPPDDVSIVAERVKQRVTQEVRDRMVTRINLILISQREKKTVSNGHLAMELVDRILSDVL
jgi:S-adenosylmethionine synthetase